MAYQTNEQRVQALIGDVLFDRTPRPANTFSVTLYDHTGLGGPMGTERVRVIGKWTFSRDVMATAFAKLLIQRLGANDERINIERDTKTLMERLDEIMTNKSNGEALVDLSSVGVAIRPDRTVDVINDFTYERPTVARVGALAEG